MVFYVFLVICSFCSCKIPGLVELSEVKVERKREENKERIKQTKNEGTKDRERGMEIERY